MSPASQIPLLGLGFRPFFLAAGGFAALAMAAWSILWFGLGQFGAVAPVLWHAHEMVYGYAIAVVAGFLLTASPNWTGRPAFRGPPLGALVALWLAARVLLLMGPSALPYAAACDLAFNLGLWLAVARPIIAVRQWRQAGILAKLALLGLGNLSYYLAVGGYWAPGYMLAVQGGIFVLVALILTMAGRVLPGFISRGTRGLPGVKSRGTRGLPGVKSRGTRGLPGVKSRGTRGLPGVKSRGTRGLPGVKSRGVRVPVEVRDPRGAMLVSLVLFLGFFVAELGWPASVAGALFAAGLFVVTTFRLVAWHTPGLWREPLLWGLYLAVVALDLGFLLYALGPWFAVTYSVALHAFAVGGVGLVTLAMMARVALGHTGRDIRQPPAGVAYALGCLGLAVIARVGLPLLVPGAYDLAVGVSQTAWVAAFVVFVVAYAPVLCRPRVDGRPG